MAKAKEKAVEPKLYMFTSENPYLYIYPNIQFVNGVFETTDEEVAKRVRQFDCVSEH